MKKLDVINQQFEHLTVISEHSKTRNGHYRYNCLCSCGKNKAILLTHLRSGKITHCGCKRKKNNLHPLWKGCGDISGNVWYNLVVRSANGSKGTRKPVDINIDVEYGWNLFLKQNRKCALSGIDIFFSIVTDGETTASLDRIDSSKGYVDGNVQWLHKDVNMMKRVYSQDYFIKICKLISLNN